MKSLALLVLLVGCDSLVSDPCMSGFHLQKGACMPNVEIGMDPDAGVPNVDAPPDTTPPDGPPSGPVCTAPQTACGDSCATLDSDPDNCGHCGRTCASGICSASSCVGDVSGHVVVVGHDYLTSDQAMDRILANSVTSGGLASNSNARVGWWKGTAVDEPAIAASVRGLQQVNITETSVGFSSFAVVSDLGLDAIVIEPQTDGAAAEAAGAEAGPALQQFLMQGHAVIGLETVNGATYRFLKGAGLVTLPAPATVAGMAVTVVTPSDAVATGVVSPYLAKAGSVAFAGAAHAVVTDSAGDVVVIHAAY